MLDDALCCWACRVRRVVRVAEREGFEPSIELLALCSLSKRVPSASRSSPLVRPANGPCSGLLASVGRLARSTPLARSCSCQPLVAHRLYVRHACCCIRGLLFGCQRRGVTGEVAEEEGFEPPASFNATDFKTVAFDRSATPPVVRGRLHIAGHGVCKAGRIERSSAPADHRTPAGGRTLGVIVSPPSRVHDRFVPGVWPRLLC